MGIVLFLIVVLVVAILVALLLAYCILRGTFAALYVLLKYIVELYLLFSFTQVVSRVNSLQESQFLKRE